MRSRVIPGSLVTIERRVPVRRLNSVDLPTLGRPTITSDGSFSVIEQTTTATRVRRRSVLEALIITDARSFTVAIQLTRTRLHDGWIGKSQGLPRKNSAWRPCLTAL